MSSFIRVIVLRLSGILVPLISLLNARAREQFTIMRPSRSFFLDAGARKLI